MTTELVDAIIESLEKEPVEWGLERDRGGDPFGCSLGGGSELYLENVKRKLKINIDELRRSKLGRWYNRTFFGDFPQIMEPYCPALPECEANRLRVAADSTIEWLSHNDNWRAEIRKSNLQAKAYEIKEALAESH